MLVVGPASAAIPGHAIEHATMGKIPPVVFSIRITLIKVELGSMLVLIFANSGTVASMTVSGQCWRQDKSTPAIQIY